MATEIAINTDTTQKFINRLEAEKSIVSSCTELFTALTTHFTSLQNSLSQKSQTLDSKFQNLETSYKETLESLHQREISIPERESAAISKVQELKENAIAEFQKPVDLDNLSDSLKKFSRRMDSSGFLKFIMSKRKESASLREEISAAVVEAVDPAALILDAVDDLMSDKIEKLGVSDKLWACSLLVQALYMEDYRFAGKVKLKWKPPEFGRSVVERAAEVLNRWKEEEGDERGIWGATEALMFLQMVVIFGLKSRFDEKFLMKLVMDNAARRDMAGVAAAIGFGKKMEEMIEDLVKNGKEIEAVYLAFEAGLTDKFSPVTLIKSHLRDIKKSTLSKDGNSSSAATGESTTTWLNSVKAAIKCVEDHNLEPEFPLDPVRKRATQLERIREERKKSIAAKSKTKRRQRPDSRHRDQKPPAKVPKFSTTHNSPMARYSSYPSNPSPAPYLTTYGASHSQSQSPAAIAQQHYGSYAVNLNYSTYDYRAAAPVYQPPSYR